VLTNNHVIEGADEIVVRLIDRRELTAELIGADPRSDLALLKVDAKDLPTVQIGHSKSLKVGEWVLAIGSPFGFDYSVTAGIVSAKGRSLPTENGDNYVPFIQTDVAINPGNSGGPLFNLDGEVVGINSQIYTRSGGFMGVSFAIPIDVAMEVVEQLKAHGRVSRGWLGVMIQEVDRNLAESFGLDKPSGALVADVVPGSPAQASGLQAGDIIVEFDGTDIDRSADLPHLVGRTRVGSTTELGVVRGGDRIIVEVVIGELSDAQGRQVGGRSDSSAPSRLGLVVEPLTDTLRERIGGDNGVLVASVDGAAQTAGIQVGDVITMLDNERVDSVATFKDIAEELQPGHSVPVLVVRGRTPSFLALHVPDS
jgi:serine protease Do